MFTSISIRNFKCFRDFKIDSLERVNLIAGSNDVGKTALLEAAFLLMGETNLAIIVPLGRYGGILNVKGPPTAVKDFLWRPLFNDFRTESTIRVRGSRTGEPDQVVELILAQAKTSTVSLQDQPVAEVGTAAEALASFNLQLKYSDGTQTPRTFTMIVGEDGIRQEPAPPPPSVPAFCLYAREPLKIKEDARILGDLIVEKEPTELVETLKIVEPRLRRLAAIPTPSGSEIYGDIGLPRMLPTALMGDGFGRFLSVLLKMAAARRGAVLVDEIENGLHYSVLGKVWVAIAQAARQFDVQVFATTHSWECIQAAQSAFEDNAPYDFRLYRLDRTNDTIKAVRYDKETLATSIVAGLEVR